MRKVALAALSGIAVALLMAGLYFSAVQAGVHLNGTEIVVAAAMLAFASSTAVFVLVALSRPTSGKTPYQRTRLNEMPAARFVSLFDDPDKLRIAARPEQSLAEILAPFDDKLKNPDQLKERKIVLVLRDSRRNSFNPVILRPLFATFQPYKLEHVVLMDHEDHFMGYIPGDRALKEFNGTNAETKIADAITKVLRDPSDNKSLRALNGITQDDTVSETDDIRQAALKLYANDAVNGLVVHKRLRPSGMITKVDLLMLTSSEPMIAGY